MRASRWRQAAGRSGPSTVCFCRFTNQIVVGGGRVGPEGNGRPSSVVGARPVHYLYFPGTEASHPGLGTGLATCLVTGEK